MIAPPEPYLRPDMRLQADYSLRDLNTLGLDHEAEWFVQLSSPEQLPDILELAAKKDLALNFIGGGSNIVLSGDIAGIVAKIDFRGMRFDSTTSQRTLTVAGGENWHKTVMASVARQWQGLENLALIPGSAGAAPVQNIGAYGLELCERLRQLTAWDKQNNALRVFDAAACQFAYRDSRFKSQDAGRFVICEVVLDLPRRPDWRLDYVGICEELGGKTATPSNVAQAVISLRRAKLPDPAEYGNAGSFFKNPVISDTELDNLLSQHPSLPNFSVSTGQYKLSAAWLIEDCGFKGHRQGDAGVSEKHALVLVNHGNATGDQILALAASIQTEVTARFGVELEIEPVIL